MKIGFDLDYIPKHELNKEHNIGIIGSGFIINECHLPGYKLGGYNIAGITSLDLDVCNNLAEKFGIKKVYATIDEMLEDPTINIIDLGVPPHMQKELVRKVASKGKDILAQKPLATNFQDAKEIVEICEEAGVKLVVNMNGRFDPSVQATKNLIDKGYIGKPLLATIQLRYMPHWQPYQKEYNRLMFLFMSVHHLDQFRFWFGTPDRIYATPIPHHSGEFKGEFSGIYTLEYDNGMVANAVDDGLTWDEQGFGVFYKIVGTEGVVYLNVGWPTGGPSKIKFYSKQLGDVWYEPKLEGSWFPGAFQYTMSELMQYIETNVEPAISGKNNLETMAMIEACYRSAEEKRAISIKDIMYSK